MKALRDPEGAELKHLLAACDLTGKHTLEIGCGDGKFTRQYMGLPRRIIAIDPDLSDLRVAKQDKNTFTNRVYFIQTRGENLPFPSHSVDIVIFASSL